MSTLVTTNLRHGGAASPNVVLASGGGVTFGGNVTLGTSVLATPSGSAPSYTCRAWVNFNGTGTVAIRASGNVSSITDNGVGDYTVNFTTAMPDANYAVTGLSATAGLSPLTIAGSSIGSGALIKTTAALQVYTYNNATTRNDAAEVNVAIIR